ncbi:MAG: GIY-YIG nuclease family protein, partial [Eggerthellaceae bacterium]|nr:GIY-YIG nuclease family protein [Eggerthellaceae bacterium]
MPAVPDTPETLEERLTRIKGELARVPALPGVYLWKTAAGVIIYVGKAKQLRARMRQYVNYEDSRLKIPLLVEQIDSFDYIVAENEHEALVLERNLINRYSPYFNADFKDDKSYPFIAITTSDVFPAIKYTREKHRPGTKYFGPYTDARAARTLVDVVRRVCPICSAQCADWRHMQRVLESGTMLDMAAKGVKPCFDHHVGLGPGVCCGACTREEYLEAIARVERFLAGHYREFIDELSSEMRSAAAELDFERASRLKQRLDTITSLTTKQTVEVTGNLNADVLGFFREETIAGVNVFVVRDGIT